jgi:hypothetical protein
LAAALLCCAQERPVEPFVPVGVRIDAQTAHAPAALEELRSLRFNIVEFPNSSGAPQVATIAQLLGEPQPVTVPIPQPAQIVVHKDVTAAHLRRLAWASLASGARALIFSDWAALTSNPPALVAAAEFADNVTRNAALFAPLLPRPGPPLVRIARGRGVTATFLESSDALVLIAINPAPREQRVRFAFTPEVPEAIWQNMESGAAVNFVAGDDGPYYERVFPPEDVLVLMIRKGWK